MIDDYESLYKELENRFKQQVELDRIRYPDSVFLPNIPPHDKVDFVFIGMEPSYNKWAKNIADAEEQISSGYRNFMYSLEDFILHYCIRRYLCHDGSTYYITDLSKGAMNTKIADIEREERYQNWYPLLQDELSIVAKESRKLFAIGTRVKQFLESVHHQPSPTYLPHYANQNAAARIRYILDNDKELEFGQFKNSEAPKIQDILIEAQKMMNEWKIPQSLIDKTMHRLIRSKSSLSDSRYKLIFVFADIFRHL